MAPSTSDTTPYNLERGALNHISIPKAEKSEWSALPAGSQIHQPIRQARRKIITHFHLQRNITSLQMKNKHTIFIHLSTLKTITLEKGHQPEHYHIPVCFIYGIT